MIPNTVHFAFTSDPAQDHKPFSFVHYLAVSSAAHYARPGEIVVHYLHEPSGPWWEAARSLVVARPHPISTALFTADFAHPAHQADAIRLETLLTEGGIFLDLDVVCLQPFAPLLSTAPAIIGEEDDQAFCCAVLLAEPGSRFIEAWIRGYDPATSDWSGFRSTGFDEYWGEMSTRYPMHLRDLAPADVTVLPPQAFYPVSWRNHDCDRLFRAPDDGGLTAAMLASSYTLHLWQMGSWKRHLAALEPDSIAASDTAFAHHLKPLLL